MSDRRMTAREILTTVLAEATGRPQPEVAARLNLIPLPGLDREYSPEEAEQWLARLRGELPQIEAWLRADGARFRARLAAGIGPKLCN